jgi:hypothetical protein
MSDDQICPGSAKDDSVPESAMSRGEDLNLEEVPQPGLWKPRRESYNEQLMHTRNKLAMATVVLLALFILLAIGSMTWITLADKPAAELGSCIEAIGTPLFGLILLVVGYYFGHSGRRARQDHD